MLQAYTIRFDECLSQTEVDTKLNQVGKWQYLSPSLFQLESHLPMNEICGYIEEKLHITTNQYQIAGKPVLYYFDQDDPFS